MSEKQVLFDTGFIVRTPGALLALMEAHVSESSLVERHLSGDFGELSEDDAELNRQAVSEGGRVLSSYRVGSEKVWVVTEADRSVTTVLLPEEY